MVALAALLFQLWGPAAGADRAPALRLDEGRPLRVALELDLDPASPVFGGRAAIGLALD